MIENTHFDSIYHLYDESIPVHIADHYLKRRIDFIKSVIGSGKILDVCCGTGILLERLVDDGYDAYGVDLSEKMLSLSNQRNPGSQALCEAMRLPFKSNLFDLVYCIAALHHIAKKELVEQTIVEMIRVSKPNGYVLIWDHNPRNLYWKILMKKVPQDDGSERLIPKKEIEKIFCKISVNDSALIHKHLGFIPDFLPQKLMIQAELIEKFFEMIPFIRGLSAHNVFLYIKRC